MYMITLYTYLTSDVYNNDIHQHIDVYDYDVYLSASSIKAKSA